MHTSWISFCLTGIVIQTVTVNTRSRL